MLAAMSSLATLAHAAAPATPAFNGLFYATAATIIPVLFLALAVQGRMYENLLQAARTLTPPWPRLPGFPGLLGVLLFLLFLVPWLVLTTATRLLWLIAWLIPAAGAVGEGSAVYALYQGHDDSGTRLGVLVATLFLILAVATGPTLAYIDAALSRRRKPGISDNPAAGASGEPEPEAGAARRGGSLRSTAPPMRPKWAKTDTEDRFRPECARQPSAARVRPYRTGDRGVTEGPSQPECERGQSPGYLP
jgi:hypothetical protein